MGGAGCLSSLVRLPDRHEGGVVVESDVDLSDWVHPYNGPDFKTMQADRHLPHLSLTRWDGGLIVRALASDLEAELGETR
jgi:hypothetical protein